MTSPYLNQARTPMEALRDLMEQAEKLAEHIIDGAPNREVSDLMEIFIEELPFDTLTGAEDALEEAETKAYHADERAMYRQPGG